MGFIEVFVMNESGAGWKDLSELTTDERISLEVEVDLSLAGFSDPVQMLCYVCLTAIPSGTGNACERHK